MRKLKLKSMSADVTVAIWGHYDDYLKITLPNSTGQIFATSDAIRLRDWLIEAFPAEDELAILNHSPCPLTLSDQEIRAIHLLSKHHEWHLEQVKPDEHGIILSDEYQDSELCNDTIDALVMPQLSVLNPPLWVVEMLLRRISCYHIHHHGFGPIFEAAMKLIKKKPEETQPSPTPPQRPGIADDNDGNAVDIQESPIPVCEDTREQEMSVQTRAYFATVEKMKKDERESVKKSPAKERVIDAACKLRKIVDELELTAKRKDKLPYYESAGKPKDVLALITDWRRLKKLEVAIKDLENKK